MLERKLPLIILRRIALFLFISGREKEQLMTAYGEQKIYVNNRKGFVKLALQYGAHIVPMVSLPIY